MFWFSGSAGLFRYKLTDQEFVQELKMQLLLCQDMWNSVDTARIAFWEYVNCLISVQLKRQFIHIQYMIIVDFVTCILDDKDDVVKLSWETSTLYSDTDLKQQL